MSKNTIIRAGELRHRVSITEATTLDDFGYPLAPVEIISVKLGIDTNLNNISSLEKEASNLEEIHFYGRFTAKIKAKQLLIFKGTTFEIQKVNNVEHRNRRINIHCIEARS